MIVKNLTIREIFTTSNRKTIETELETRKGTVRASVPIGTSRGKHEVVFLPVEDVIRNFVGIRRHFIGQSFDDQEEVDGFLRILDKTTNFKEIGGNLALGLSAVFLKGFAMERGVEVFEVLAEKNSELPLPLCNVVGGLSWRSDIQEFLLMPIHQKSFFDSMTTLSAAYDEIGRALKKADPNFAFGRNLESAWVSSMGFEAILKILKKIADRMLLRIGLDVAASHLWNGKHYVFSSGEKLSRPEQIALFQDMASKYPIYYIEDPFHEDDFLAFSVLTCRLAKRLICGDDLFVTNMERLRTGIERKAANAIIIKPNQVGTITDTIKVVREAKKGGIKTVMSHRSGETEDTLVCHLAVGLGCDYVKFGIGGERAVKINEMLRIEEKLVEKDYLSQS